VQVDERVTRADLSRVTGDPNAKVWVVIVSDFQCPYCKVWHDSTGPQLKKEFVETGKVRLAYVHFPLAQHHGAMPAAEASMCAGAQGKFWEYHDKLFETQNSWETETTPALAFERYAKDMGLDMAAYKACIDSHVMAPMIVADREKSSRAGAGSTPTFLIGDESFSGAQPIETFRTAIAKALQTSAK
jgi:protein-disulfide isomerase